MTCQKAFEKWLTSQNKEKPRAEEIEAATEIPVVTPTLTRFRLRTKSAPTSLTRPTPPITHTPPSHEERPETHEVPAEQISTGRKRAADEPVEEMDATRAEESQVEETSMKISTVENLKHILEMELCADAEDDLDGIYSDDGLDWWPAEKVRQGDLKELQGLFDRSSTTSTRRSAKRRKATALYQFEDCAKDQRREREVSHVSSRL